MKTGRSNNCRIFFLAVLILALTVFTRNEGIYKILVEYQLKKESNYENYKEQLLKLNSFDEKSEIKVEEKIAKKKQEPKILKEIIPIIDGTHVNQLPRFWQEDRPWTVGFSGPKCKDPEFLVLINSAPGNFNFRQVHRQYLRRMMKRFNIEYKFLIGQTVLEKEYDKNKDMVFGNLDDSYKNLPLKTKVAYEYLASCHFPPKYFLLIDDDTWFAVEPIRKTLQDSRAVNQIYGNMRRGSPRGPWSEKTKLVVNTTIWEPDKWPTWVDGPCTFMRGDAAQKIAQTASKTNWLEAIPVEDVFFSGIVRLKAKLKEPLTRTKFNPERIHCRHLKNNLPQLKKLMNYKPPASS